MNILSGLKLTRSPIIFIKLLNSLNQELAIDELIEMKEQDSEELKSVDPVQSEDRMTVGKLTEELSLIEQLPAHQEIRPGMFSAAVTIVLDGGARSAAIATFRLLTGKDCLRAYFFCFKIVDSPICILCSTGQEMNANHIETITLYIILL
ncbi:hypothetical protein TNCV_3555941 [Trichonephila clavipes]|nr:hypothetical protein TNCV_3555941 [Trichonephila clavipes]